MVRSAAVLFRERGVAATGFREVAAHSGVSRGSISHHFPGGKTELVRDAVRWSGAEVAARLDEALRAGDPVQGVAEFVAMWRCVVVDSDARAGCTVAAVATESHDQDVLAVAAEVFAAWRRPLADALSAAGVAPGRARRLATTVVAALEGALVLCRAERGPGPLADTGAELAVLVGAVLRQGRPPGEEGPAASQAATA